MSSLLSVECIEGEGVESGLCEPAVISRSFFFESSMAKIESRYQTKLSFAHKV
jgi:hypothetical protein